MGVNKAATLAFLTGGGELGERMRTKDWSQTALGPPSQWPQSLRTTVSTCLNAHLPILIGWGPERVMLYNDAYRLILGDKHPHALGSKGRDIWPGVWDTPGPGQEGGKADGSENQLLTVNRHGFPGADYFSYSLSPIYDESDGIGGTFCIVTKKTDTLLAEQQRQELNRVRQENRRTQMQAETNERLLDAMIQQTPLGVGIFYGPDYIIERANPTLCQLWNHSPEELLGYPLFTASPESTGQGFEAMLDSVRETGIAFQGLDQSARLYRNGRLETVYFDFSYEPIHSPDGRIERVMVVATEVTKAREARLLMEENAKRLQTLFEQAPVAVAILGPGPDLVYELTNPFYCELIGRPADQFVGKPLREAVPESAEQGFDELLLQVMAMGIAHVDREAAVDVVRNGQRETIYVDFVFQPRRSHIRIAPANRPDHGEPARDAANQPQPDDSITGVVVIANDITQAVRTRQRVESNERLLAAIIQQTPLGVGIFVGPDFIVELANPTICHLWGRTQEQVIGKPLFTVLPEATGQGFEELLQGVYKTGNPFEGHELPVTLERNGQLETVYFDFVYDALRNANGSIERIMVVATEVTKVREIRQRLEASEARMRSLFAQAPVAIAILRGPTFVVELANPGICTIWNRTEAQLLGHPIFEVLTESAGQGFEELLTSVLQTGVPFVGNELPVPFLRDGKATTVYVNFVYEPLRDRSDGRTPDGRTPDGSTPDGPITGIVVVGTDVTEQVLTRQHTDQLLIRERELNELKSNFVTLASHEFRTPMGTILSSASLIGRYTGVDDGAKRERHVQQIKSAVNGLTELLNDFLSFSQMEKSPLYGRPHPLSIITFCEEVIDDLQTLIKPGQHILYTHRSGEPAILLDGQMLKSILINLLVNASKYSANDKEIELTTRVEGDQLWLTVRDEGIGIPDEDKDRLFINFFRARNANHVAGTGLGLYVVKRYVDLLGGKVTFTSQLDSGTAFTVQLPISLPLR
ncbi:PAS domain-containing sensor histidine kinase [Spirosoma spitsbergense]|uniref:PAS domain-containing sensor histidine kinase n=1 Tax=Spirosoma spitsbergense TaxID=431554 RepID=UPI000366745F|nr:PAS domain-containing sensor histidine kinase [Spirosoma spitsbergense]